MLNQRQATKESSIKSVDREKNTVHHKRTLIIGDSILTGINTKGLNNRVKICAKGGAKISDMREELSVHDLTSVANVIISVGGYDYSSRLKVKNIRGVIRSAGRFKKEREQELHYLPQQNDTTRRHRYDRIQQRNTTSI